jgi:hypothetical protein
MNLNPECKENFMSEAEKSAVSDQIINKAPSLGPSLAGIAINFLLQPGDTFFQFI